MSDKKSDTLFCLERLAEEVKKYNGSQVPTAQENRSLNLALAGCFVEFARRMGERLDDITPQRSAKIWFIDRVLPGLVQGAILFLFGFLFATWLHIGGYIAP